MKASFDSLVLLLVYAIRLKAQSAATVYINTAICSSPNTLLQPPGSPPSIGSNATSLKSSGASGTLLSPTSSPTSGPDLSAFLITFQSTTNSNDNPTQSRLLSKRQGTGNEGYLNANGSGQNDCKTTSKFALVDEQLFAYTVAGSPTSVYSVPSDGESALFVPSDSPSSTAITRSWRVDGGQLIWANDLFYNSIATFCQFPSGSIEVFYGAPPPGSCKPLQFSIQAVSACPGYVGDINSGSSSSISLPVSVPSGLPTGSSGVPVSPTVAHTFPSGFTVSSSSSFTGQPFGNSSTLQSSTTSLSSSRSSSTTTSSSQRLTSSSTSVLLSRNSSVATGAGTSPPLPSGTGSSAVTAPECDSGPFTLRHYGRGKTLNVNSPARVKRKGSKNTQFPGNLATCDAIERAINFVGRASPFHTFEVWYHSLANLWVVHADAGTLDDDSWFNVSNPPAREVYGFARPQDPPVGDPRCTPRGWKNFYHDSFYQLPLGDLEDEPDTIRNVNNDCSAIAACMGEANDDRFETFEVIYDQTQNSWTCGLVDDLIDDPGEFRAEKDSIARGYGYYKLPPATIDKPNCTPQGWTLISYGSEKILQTENAANQVQSQPSKSGKTVASTDCNAIAACKALANGDSYRTFQVVFAGSSYTCTEYSGSLSGSSDVSRDNWDAERVFVFSRPLEAVDDPGCTPVAWQLVAHVAEKRLGAGNSADTGGAPQRTVLPSMANDCAAIEACRSIAQDSFYHTFETLFDSASNSYTCVRYEGYLQQASEVDVADATATRNYVLTRYEVTDPGCTPAGWTEIFAGSDNVLVEPNAATQNQIAFTVTATINRGYSVCEAISQANSEAFQLGHRTFQVVLDWPTRNYDVTIYPGPLPDASQVTKGDSNAEKVFIYTLQVKTVNDPSCPQLGDWSNFYHGSGKDLDANLPNGYDQIAKKALKTVSNDCDAVSQCLKFASQSHYQTTITYFDSVANTWYCKWVQQAFNDATKFDTTALNIDRSYAYVQQDPCVGQTITSSEYNYYRQFYDGLDAYLPDGTPPSSSTSVQVDNLDKDVYTNVCLALQHCAYLAYTYYNNPHRQVFTLQTNPAQTSVYTCTLWAPSYSDPAGFEDKAGALNSYGYWLQVA